MVGDQQTGTILLYGILSIFFDSVCLSLGKDCSLQIMVFSCKFTRLADSGGSGHCSGRNMIRLEERSVTQVTADSAGLWHAACTARGIFWVAVLVIVGCCVECNLYYVRTMSKSQELTCLIILKEQGGYHSMTIHPIWRIDEIIHRTPYVKIWADFSFGRFKSTSLDMHNDFGAPPKKQSLPLSPD